MYVHLFFPSVPRLLRLIRVSVKQRENVVFVERIFPPSFKEPLCQICTKGIVSEESASLFDNLRSMFQLEVNMALEQKSRPSTPLPSSARSSLKRLIDVFSNTEFEEEGQLASLCESEWGLNTRKSRVPSRTKCSRVWAQGKRRFFLIHPSIQKTIKIEWIKPYRRFFLVRYFQ